ncbi:Spy/CpxP family protein refolding chaperone [Microvirga sp. CF3062]|uniref:Spy/CpxP family protein refolding chaperone n=1 Tax=Microvirga sp. CF3062 TaxID=3110182 RepID=UPI002E789103|nr:Spy/CpxP family protein refolding chaperone [Microvirga sp. CF3062]MEE1658197.1 Spy/CpxP family protein refolding chaperone [Microvirga sp. CF3062]
MKTIATIALAALLAGSGTYALAQPAPAPDAPAASQDQSRQDRRPRLSQDDFNRLVDARIASIKAGLKLSADQERLWTPAETAIRAAASERFTRMQERPDRDERQSMDFMQRLERRSTMVSERAQRSIAVTTALRPLWDTLTEDQKRIAPRLLREAVNNDGPRWHDRGGRQGRDGRGHHRMGMMEHGRGGMDRGGPRGPVQQ